MPAIKYQSVRCHGLFKCMCMCTLHALLSSSLKRSTGVFSPQISQFDNALGIIPLYMVLEIIPTLYTGAAFETASKVCCLSLQLMVEFFIWASFFKLRLKNYARLALFNSNTCM